MAKTTNKEYENEQNEYREHYELLYRSQSPVLGEQTFKDGRPKVKNSALYGVAQIKQRLFDIENDSTDKHGIEVLSYLNEARKKRDEAIAKWKHWESAQAKNYDKPFGQHLEQIERYRARISILEEEARVLNKQVREYDAKEAEKDNKLKQRPLMQRGSGKMNNGVLVSWDYRELTKDKDGRYVFVDNGEDLEEYKAETFRLQQIEKDRKAEEYAKNNPMQRVGVS